ncbi:MAG: glycosyltransferase [Xanthomarina sp.]
MKPLVSICCTSYNQENYIAQAIEGFLSQKTSFPLEIIIHDDASTDRTVEIIKAYAKKDLRITTVFQSENQYSKNIKIWPNYLFPRARGKYIALCEGDDYWTDPLKLQKQVDFLESHPDYVIAWTNYQVYNGKLFLKNNFNHTEQNTTIDFNNLFSQYCTYTLTSVFRRDAIDIPLLKTLKYFKDNSLYVALLKQGKGVFMDFESAVYRIHEGGVYSLQSDFIQNYSSYLNLLEVTNAIPESKTVNIKKVIKSLGDASAFEVLRLKKMGEELSQNQLDFMNSYFKKVGLMTKFKYYKRLFKFKFLK